MAMKRYQSAISLAITCNLFVMICELTLINANMLKIFCTFHRHRLTEMDCDMLTINHRNYLHSVAEYEKIFLVQSPGNHPFSLVTGILLSYFYFTVTE